MDDQCAAELRKLQKENEEELEKLRTANEARKKDIKRQLRDEVSTDSFVHR